MKKFITLIAASFLLFSASSCNNEVIEEKYRQFFRDYLHVADEYAVKMKVAELTKTTDRFEKRHRNAKLAHVLIWHRDSPKENTLLFSKKYLDSTMKYPKIHWGDDRKINVFVEKEYVLVDYRPRDSKVSYRLIFFR